MEQITVETIGNVAEFINSVRLNTYYLLPKDCRYSKVKIEKRTDPFTKELLYSYMLEYNYAVTGMVSTIFPMKDAQYVKRFKTEDGAKRSTIKKYAQHFF